MKDVRHNNPLVGTCDPNSNNLMATFVLVGSADRPTNRLKIFLSKACSPNRDICPSNDSKFSTEMIVFCRHVNFSKISSIPWKIRSFSSLRLEQFEKKMICPIWNLPSMGIKTNRSVLGKASRWNIVILACWSIWYDLRTESSRMATINEQSTRCFSSFATLFHISLTRIYARDHIQKSERSVESAFPPCSDFIVI